MDVPEKVQQRIREITSGTTDGTDRYTVLWVGQHLFLAKRKGTRFWSSMMEPNKYSPACLRLYEIDLKFGDSWAKGEYAELHPKDIEDRRRLTPSIVKECIEKAKVADAEYLGRLKQAEDAKKTEEENVEASKTIVIQCAKGLGFSGNKAKHYSSGSKEYVSLEVEKKIQLKLPYSQVLGIRNATLEAVFIAEVGSDEVDIHFKVRGKEKKACLWIDTPDDPKAWMDCIEER
jgi:hypothetical protein